MLYQNYFVYSLLKLVYIIHLNRYIECLNNLKIRSLLLASGEISHLMSGETDQS